MSEILSPNTMMPSRIPATGSPAVIVGSDACSGPELNALCISRMPTAPVATRQYADQLCSIPEIPWFCRICSVCRVSASWMPNTRPAPRPVRVARRLPDLRRPACTAANAMKAMPPAAGQCEKDPNDCPIGWMTRASDRIVSPAISTNAPTISVMRTG